MASETRRTFLAGVGAAAAAGGLLAPEALALDPQGEMKREIIPGSPRPQFSRAVRCGRMVWASGVVGRDRTTDQLATPGAKAQFTQALQNLKASVEAAGTTMDNVVKCTCFLTAASEFGVFNEVYSKFFPKDPPARSTVVVKELVVPGAKLEIECVALV